MSRIGKQKIEIPSGVEVNVSKDLISVKGPKGQLEKAYSREVKIEVSDGVVQVNPVRETRTARAMWGTFASHIINMIKGVTDGYERKLEITGVGYRAEMEGQNLKLLVGYSHPVIKTPPQGVSVEIVKNVVTLSGIDKEVLGQFAAEIREVRKPEPYKGKGIAYQGEYIIRKQGKRAAK